MKFQGKFEWTDHLHAQLLNMRVAGVVRVLAYIVLVLFTFLLVAGWIFTLDGKIPMSLMILSSLIAVLFLLYFPLFRYVILPRMTRRIFSQQKGLSMPLEYEITEAGFKFSNELVSATYPWTYFTKWKEDDKLWMLYYSDMAFSMVPKRFFTTPEQSEVLGQLLTQNHIPEAKSNQIIGYLFLALMLLWIALSALAYFIFLSP